MDSLCEDCGGKCCVGIIEVMPDDDVYEDDFLAIDVPEHNRFRVMKTDGTNRCIALMSDGLCSIYDKRPSVCRRFEIGGECCGDFRSGRKNRHSCKSCRLFE